MTVLAYVPTALPATAARDRQRRLFALAAPIIIGLLSRLGMVWIETLMVRSLGSAAVAAVGLGNWWTMLAGAFFVGGVRTGVQTIVARRAGEERPEAAAETLNAGLLACAGLVIPCSIALLLAVPHLFGHISKNPEIALLTGAYLKARIAFLVFETLGAAFDGFWAGIGRSRVFLGVVWFTNVLNLGLNWVLIHGHLGAAPLGVGGAGLAAGLSFFAAGALNLVLVHRIGGGLRRVFPARAAFAGLARMSVPSGLQRVSLFATQVAIYEIAAKLGTASVVATHAIALLINPIAQVAVGLGLAASTLVGGALGSKDLAGARRTGWEATAIGAGLSLLISLPLMIAPRFCLSFIIRDPQIVGAATTSLVIVGAAQLVEGAGWLLSSVLIGAGIPRTVNRLTWLVQWGIGLPIAYAWSVTFGGGLAALWAARALWRALYAVIMFALFWRGRWDRAHV